MKRISLKDHIAQSKIAVAANKAKGNRHGQILSMLYSDPYHFIEELIQNAEDACARRKGPSGAGYLKIVFHNDGIDFLHNGDPFTETDLMAITTFASTTKKGLPGVNQIGKFGIGFRSVYGITDSPEIHSGIHHYKINDFEVLEETESCDTGEFTTLITLPFKASLSDGFKSQLIENIIGLNPKFLLFLKHIGQVEIIAECRNVVLTSATEPFGKNLYERNIQSYENGVRKNFRYLLFTRNAGQLKEVAIAIALNESNIIVQEKHPIASVYFPTQLRIAHSVLIHGRFTTTPNRENIPFSNEWTPENNKLLSVLSALVRIMLRSLQSEKMLNAAFWNLFSWSNDSSDPISTVVSASLNDFIQSSKCLTGASEKIFAVADLCVAEDESMMPLVSGKDLFAVYSRIDFIHPQLSANETFVSHLRKNHKLKLADLDSFAFHIANHPEFLQKKPLAFYPALFKFLSTYPRMWDLAHQGRYYNLRRSAIIPDKSKKPTIPFSSDNRPQIFIGKAASNIVTVHPDLASDSDCLNFFSMLGIPDTAPAISEAEQLLRKFSTRSTHQWWLKLFELFGKSDETVKERIRQKTEEMECLPAIQSGSGEKIFVQPAQAYIANNSLTSFLSYHPAFFAHEQLYQVFTSHGIEASQLSDFLIQLGVADGLKIIAFHGNLSDERKSELRQGADVFPLVRETVQDYTIEGLDSFIAHAAPSASVALWKLLDKIKEKFRTSTYTFESYVRSETAHFDPEYILKLKKAAWLFDADLQTVSPKGFPVEKLHPYFHQAQPESLWMAEAMEMITDGITPDEKELLAIIRNNSLSAGSLKQLLKNNASDYLYHPYVPLETNTERQASSADAASADILALSVAPFGAGYENWDSILFEEKTSMLKDYLLKTIFAASKTMQAETVASGYIRITDRDIVLTHLFTGIKPSSGEPILLPRSFTDRWNEQPGRKDVGLFVYNLSDHTCVEIKPLHLIDFLHTNLVATIKPMRLSHD